MAVAELTPEPPCPYITYLSCGSCLQSETFPSISILPLNIDLFPCNTEGRSLCLSSRLPCDTTLIVCLHSWFEYGYNVNKCFILLIIHLYLSFGVTMLPSFLQLTLGRGLPSALHGSTITSPSFADMSRGSVRITGAS